VWKFVLLAIAAAVVLGVGLALMLSWSAMRNTVARFADLEASAATPTSSFDVAMLDGLPEVARRYFLHAIAPGTPLRTTVRLRMEGEFLLGDKNQYQTYAMSAVQILSPPDQFVWIPTMKSGFLEITGSDGLAAGSAWTQFWLNGLVPVVSQQDTPDLVRSALSRSAMEAVWAPAALLPQNGVRWEQVGPDTAKIAFPTGIEPILLLLGPDGSVREMSTMRWSNANADNSFRLQPFGATVEAEGAFAGYTIPTRVKVGNHFGTDSYLPFFQANIIEATHLQRELAKVGTGVTLASVAASAVRLL
jgi:hypothetical protein